MVTSPRRHPTTHWKRRQHQHRRQQNNRSMSTGTISLVVEEIKSQLKRLPTQSSLGPDSVPYYMWKYTEDSAVFLSMIYNICLHNRKTPDSWKSSNIILIYKKGDRSVPNNLRPISLQPTIYKSYAAILAKRLGSWVMDEENICKSQKGFLPFEGCLEHSFPLRSVFEDSKSTPL